MITDNEPQINAVETTFTVISAIVELQGANVSEIAQYLDMPISTTFEHLRNARVARLRRPTSRGVSAEH